MWWKVVLCLGIPNVLSGCNIAYYSGRNVVNEPAQAINQFKLRQRMRAEARTAWHYECQQYPRGAFSAAFANGFIDGYADYLDNGGVPAPPGSPPLRYRRHVDDFTPEGQTDQQDYMDGFKHGAEVAEATGHRQAVLVPIYKPGSPPEQRLNITCVPAAPGTLGTLPMPSPYPRPMPLPVPPGGILAPQPKPAPPGNPLQPDIGPIMRTPFSPSLLPTSVGEVGSARWGAQVGQAAAVESLPAERQPELIIERGLPPVTSPPE